MCAGENRSGDYEVIARQPLPNVVHYSANGIEICRAQTFWPDGNLCLNN
jgi:hypothetical protein